MTADARVHPRQSGLICGLGGTGQEEAVGLFVYWTVGREAEKTIGGRPIPSSSELRHSFVLRD
jgi:hypothetical protein